MSNEAKARRAKITIGSIEVDGFQLPDGSYRMSITSAAEAIETSQQNATNFFRSKTFKALKGEGYTPQETIQVSPEEQLRGQTRITALPLDIAWDFWLYQCSRGSKQAYRLLRALGTETLERRFDAAFGVERSESERNQLLSQRLQKTEADLDRLGEAYAEPDLLREQVARLEEQIRHLGGEPWQSPSDDLI